MSETQIDMRSIERSYTNLRGARNHAMVEGCPTPPANKLDAIAAVPLVATVEVVLKALQQAAG